MSVVSSPHISEEYHCNTCNSALNRNNLINDRRCSSCHNLVEIRIKTEKLDNSCLRVEVRDLKIDDFILLHRGDEFRRILNLKREENIIRVAIEKYKVLPLDQNCIILKLNGGWYH